MQSRKLARGDILWKQGEPADRMAVVDGGKLGVWTDRRLVGIMYPKMVLGEAALLALGEARAVVRSASVIAVEDGTTVTEYPATLIRDAMGAGVPRLVLRTLSGQICRNALLLLAAHPHEPALEHILRGLISGQVEGERHLRAVSTWDRFLVVFELLYHLREGLDAMRTALVEPRRDAELTLVRASELSKNLLKSEDAIADVLEFLAAERERSELAGFTPPER
jgi:CRP-like cAMP-binding protein